MDIKQLTKIQIAFLKIVNYATWVEAEQEFPEFTEADMLEPFKKLNFSSATVPAVFMKYCRLAMKSKSGSNEAIQQG